MGNYDSNRTPLLSQQQDSVEDDESAEHRHASCFSIIAQIVRAIFAPTIIKAASGPILALILFCIAKYQRFGGDVPGTASPETIGVMLGTLAWMASWWVLLPVPIAITALLPLCLFPLCGVMGAAQVAKLYTNEVVTLMLGTFILAIAITKYDVHKRISLNILLFTSGETMNPRLVLLGFLVGPGFLSAWMSNTVCAAMMVPMATGVLHNLHPDHHVSIVRSKSESAALAEEGSGQAEVDTELHAKEAEAAIHQFGQGVILGVTYGIAIGGMATIIGCGPDLVLPGIYSSIFPDGPEVSFLLWAAFAVPLVLLIAGPLWWYLCQRYCPTDSIHMIEASLNRKTLEKAYEALGPIKFSEVFIFSEFIIIVLLWVTLNFGQTPGWSYFFNNYPTEGTVSVVGATVLFLVPDLDRKGVKLMDWKSCKDISWSVILLLGGGFALSGGIQSTGVSTWIGQNMNFFIYIPYLLITPVLSILLGFVTEFASNAAVATLFLPIFADVAVYINAHPLLLMLPTTIASNFAFILPSGAPPNAIACGTEYLTVPTMIRPGLVLHSIGTVVLTILVPTLGAFLFGLDQPAESLPWVG